MTISSLLATGTLLVLASCADTAAQKNDADVAAWRATLPEPGADYGSYPTNYQNAIETAFVRQLKDPDSAKFSDFTAPKHDQMVQVEYATHGVGVNKTAVYGYSSCVSVNAKNSYGGYTGNKQYWFLIRNGQVMRTEPAGGLVYIGHGATC